MRAVVGVGVCCTSNGGEGFTVPRIVAPVTLLYGRGGGGIPPMVRAEEGVCWLEGFVACRGLGRIEIWNGRLGWAGLVMGKEIRMRLWLWLGFGLAWLARGRSLEVGEGWLAVPR
jgi:hypothetical protein